MDVSSCLLASRSEDLHKNIFLSFLLHVLFHVYIIGWKKLKKKERQTRQTKVTIDNTNNTFSIVVSLE